MEYREIGKYYWGNTNIQTFLYGTDLSRAGLDQVQFVNHNMPAGTPIHEWYSYTDYQLNRDIPVLPFLYDGKTYRIEPDIQTKPEGAFQLEILFYDRFEKLTETKVLWPPLFAFVYPEGSFYYTVRLVNAGCDELAFNNFKLLEAVDEVR
jgi:accessory secretory protein Asp3